MTLLPEGVLPINKPPGMTSHDVVAKARRLLRLRRIGHTGTLDPLATGVLPLVLGRATRLSDLLSEMPKCYEAEMIFGFSTDTEDISGNVTETAENADLDETTLAAVLQTFKGDILQVPPMYSAIKQGGKRLYELAREGIVVERAPRKVTIHELELTGFGRTDGRPVARIRVRCSKGTYIRTLCTDIGRKLGIPAVMSKLERTESGGITLDQALTLDRLEQLVAEGDPGRAIIPVDRALSHLPDVHLDDGQAAKAANGQSISLPSPPAEAGSSGLLRVYGGGRFIGLFRLTDNGKTIAPYKVFAAER